MLRMDKKIKEQYNDSIFTEAISRYGVTKDLIKLLDGFESFIYEFSKGDREYILRISHSLRRSANMINGEIEWVNYLADNGVSVSRAVPSEYGNLVEVINQEDSHFAAVAFEKAKGAPPAREVRNSDLFRQMGQMTGKMHALTKKFKSSRLEYKRPEWDEEIDGIAEKYLPSTQRKVIEKFNQLLNHHHNLPKGTDSYGLIHSDFHPGNFFVDKGKITLFDFDDCQYLWFIHDIAISLFYVVSHNCVGKKELEFARKFYQSFMNGYITENQLDRFWLDQIPYFLKMREIDLYIIIHRSFDLNNLDPWCSSFMENRQQKIENDIPYVDISFR